ncbi:MAG TPA: RNA polymerase sigma factor [Verrucomicrobiales bacterium]|jgi:RNA polymerase sigma-70 factor (ECF subfamily)|nr:RNA polymerase sigma factor [Verrucomicrobiales bacterium]
MSSSAHPTDHAADAADMAALCAGRVEALDSLMLRHQARLLHWLIRLTGCEASAGDIAQDAFVRVFEKRNQFKKGGKFSNWLYTIAANLVRDARRFQSRHPHLSLEAESEPGAGDALSAHLPDEAPGPSAACENRERAAAVRAAIAALPEDLRLAITLAEYEDRSMADIAEITGSSVKAVESRLYRARKDLRVALAGFLAGSPVLP